MKRIPVSVSKGTSYTVTVGNGILSDVGKTVKTLLPACGTVCILSDDNVFPLYGETVTRSLRDAGFRVISHVIPHGEHSKTLSVYGDFLNFLASEHLTRTDALAALGGGVVGDLCGFAAATYLRGVPYIQLPTSLLAMVDSSVGGKTAVDLPAGKNLCGAFYPPAGVLCDSSVLGTLPELWFADGMAEVIKYAMLFDAPLADELTRTGSAFDREEIVARCIAHKKRVVEADEFDRGERQLLNFGHTPAHGIEVLSGYEIPHGHAVAMGMMLMTRAAEGLGFCAPGTAEKLHALLTLFRLPAETAFSAEALSRAVFTDKKRSGNTITFILPRSMGSCFLHPIPAEDAEAFLLAGMKH